MSLSSTSSTTDIGSAAGAMRSTSRETPSSRTLKSVAVRSVTGASSLFGDADEDVLFARLALRGERGRGADRQCDDGHDERVPARSHIGAPVRSISSPRPPGAGQHQWGSTIESPVEPGPWSRTGAEQRKALRPDQSSNGEGRPKALVPAVPGRVPGFRIECRAGSGRRLHAGRRDRAARGRGIRASIGGWVRRPGACSIGLLLGIAVGFYELIKSTWQRPSA